LVDVELIYRNSETFNGPASVYTTTAKELYDSALKYIEENRVQLDELERNIDEAKEKAMAELDTESLASRPESRHTLVSDLLAGPSNVFEETGTRSRSIFSDEAKLSEGEIVDSDDDGNGMGMPDETAEQQLDEDTVGFYQHEPDMETQQLFAEFLGGQVPSRMEVEGRIHDDLAMSDSDEDEPTSKKVRGMREDDTFDFSKL